ncbi:M23 family metallopeptidase [Patescibacteria group bacterium]|nr:M23 family metallopeptidase [Patescibacteria group bacterium]
MPIHVTSSEEMVSPSSSSVRSLVWPINRPLERITKKPFGLKVSPSDSPVQPERFVGYHTGVDFEVFPEETATDVSISALCDGPVLVRRSATGYGGLLVQSCELDGEAITVIYGHLRLSSISVRIGDTLKAGEVFALLGTGESAETSGERKHLHLGIHRGSSQNILGYVTREPELKNWLDVRSLSSVLQPAP